jgi:hypothetical protein
MRETVYRMKARRVQALPDEEVQASEYFLEYRADEDRVIYRQVDYGHERPLLGRRQLLSTEHHTKRDLEGSMDIMLGIAARCRAMGYVVLVLTDRREQLREVIANAREHSEERGPRAPRGRKITTRDSVTLSSDAADDDADEQAPI